MKRFLFSIAALSIFALNSCGGGNNPVVVMDTSAGTIKMELYKNKAPISVENFLKYVDEKHYDNTIFHRVMENFMIQGGGFDTAYEEKKTHEGIKNESKNGLANDRGTIAMARTGDPHSASAQFYINVVDNDELNGNAGKWGYAVFGKVIEGMDVVDVIREEKTTSRKMKALDPRDNKLVEQPFDDVPEEQVVIKSIRRLKKK